MRFLFKLFEGNKKIQRTYKPSKDLIEFADLLGEVRKYSNYVSQLPKNVRHSAYVMTSSLVTSSLLNASISNFKNNTPEHYDPLVEMLQEELKEADNKLSNSNFPTRGQAA